ncbi:hypothetical protein BAE44_0016166 [Dichanthelium oligosanthes]|uniref:EGF-like domain-containing protein n=1 Tax=Dichanthelium oligosanthes TaxID=888268 RepID=A0A1E5VCP8_9POAL|nr:hypothetical protein BAE44_0016166 [Dichanthelium oligosanthes]
MMVVVARSSAVLLLLALLGGAAVGGGVSSVCDTANCGRGSCAEVPGLPPNYECRCDLGWSHALELFPFSPCIVPNCTFNGACLNLSLTPPTAIPKDVCAVVSCGVGGACRPGDAMFSYSCECRLGYANLLNLTALPCVKDCACLRQRLLRPGTRPGTEPGAAADAVAGSIRRSQHAAGVICSSLRHKRQCNYFARLCFVAESTAAAIAACVVVNCGPGECKKDEGFHYHCECEAGFANMLNDTKFPCVDDNCLMGMHCPALDDPAPPAAPTVSPAPPGLVTERSLLLQLLLASLAVAQVM